MREEKQGAGLTLYRKDLLWLKEQLQDQAPVNESRHQVLWAEKRLLHWLKYRDNHNLESAILTSEDQGRVWGLKFDQMELKTLTQMVPMIFLLLSHNHPKEAILVQIFLWIKSILV